MDPTAHGIVQLDRERSVDGVPCMKSQTRLRDTAVRIFRFDEQQDALQVRRHTLVEGTPDQGRRIGVEIEPGNGEQICVVQLGHRQRIKDRLVDGPALMRGTELGQGSAAR
jgi:hypothetical protein